MFPRTATKEKTEWSRLSSEDIGGHATDNMMAIFKYVKGCWRQEKEKTDTECTKTGDMDLHVLVPKSFFLTKYL